MAYCIEGKDQPQYCGDHNGGAEEDQEERRGGGRHGDHQLPVCQKRMERKEVGASAHQRGHKEN